MVKKLSPVHPGEILLEEFMKPLGLTRQRVAADLDVPPSRIAEIVRGERAITGETALLFSEYFGTDARFWLNLQSQYALEVAEDERAASKRRPVRPHGLTMGATA